MYMHSFPVCCRVPAVLQFTGLAVAVEEATVVMLDIVDMAVVMVMVIVTQVEQVLGLQGNDSLL